jgi:hypothetical protein
MRVWIALASCKKNHYFCKETMQAWYVLQQRSTYGEVNPLNGDNLMQATRKSAPADTEGKRETKKQVTLLLVNICPDTRETTVNGKTYWVRKASVRNNNGDAKPIEVWGTEKQWQWFDGETVNAEFAPSPKTGGYRWYFSPVTKAPVYLEEDEFENG